MKLMGKLPLFITIFFITMVPLLGFSWLVDSILNGENVTWFSFGFAIFLSILIGLVLAFYKAFTLYEFKTQIHLEDNSRKFRRRSDSAMRSMYYRRTQLMGNIWIYNPSRKNGFPRFPIRIKIVDGRYAKICGPKKWVDKYIKALGMTGHVKLF
ncbi:MAG: hypothetical protein ACLFSQ_02540 [Candidatus Zixiibacteriota bacterium]